MSGTVAVLPAIMEGIRDRLLTIPGMRATSGPMDNPTPPYAYPFVQQIQYDGAFNKGLTTYTIGVQVLVARVSESNGFDRLYEYLAPQGTVSVKAAIEADRQLGSAVYDLRVSDASNVSSVTLGAGDVAYLSAEWTVQVYAE